jgi:hypothetical protein
MKADQFMDTLTRLFAIQNRYDPAAVEVVVITTDPSIGPRASTPVKSVGLGFDWEHNRLVLETETPLMFQKKDLQDEIRKVREEYGKKWLDQQRRIRELEALLKEKIERKP